MAEPVRLGHRIEKALVSPENRVFVSAVTPWEIAIKQALGRLQFPLGRYAETIGRMGCDNLPILPAHGITAGALPRHHNDPFDRLLIGQAIVENLMIVSTDPMFAHYDARVFSPAIGER